ncbi:MAG: response regulator [Alphaproteobacteria bacterium]|nr:response regulator [Alphaproteobacteria bacterium]
MRSPAARRALALSRRNARSRRGLPHDPPTGADRQPPAVPKRVLIVEDNEPSRRLLHDLLEAHGYEVLQARDGITSVQLARQHLPDLILMDLQLPDISGLDATRRLKRGRRTRAIPVVAVTAFAMAGDEQRSLASGCDAYVAKPIRVQEFLRLVREFVSAPRRPDTVPELA